MIDKLYRILIRTSEHKDGITREDLTRHTDAVYSIDYLVREHYLSEGVNEDGGPDGIYYIDKRGLSYVIDHNNEMRRFWRNFFSQFVTGLLTGSVAALVLERVILWLLSRGQ